MPAGGQAGLGEQQVAQQACFGVVAANSHWGARKDQKGLQPSGTDTAHRQRDLQEKANGNRRLPIPEANCHTRCVQGANRRALPCVRTI
jgi:hypothetical protein